MRYDKHTLHYNVCKYITRIWKLQYCIFQEISHHYTHEIQSQLQKLKILANYSSKFNYTASHCLKKKIQNYYITVRSPALDKWLRLTYQSRHCPSASQVPIKKTYWLVYPTTYHKLSSPVTGLGLFPSSSFIHNPAIFVMPVSWSFGLLESWSLLSISSFPTPAFLTCFCSVRSHVHSQISQMLSST